MDYSMFLGISFMSEGRIAKELMVVRDQKDEIAKDISSRFGMALVYEVRSVENGVICVDLNQTREVWFHGEICHYIQGGDLEERRIINAKE